MPIMHDLPCRIQRDCLNMLNKQALMSVKIIIRVQIKV